MKLLERTATIRGFSLLFGLFLIVFGIILNAMSKLAYITGGSGILDAEFGYSKQKVMEVLGSYGEEGMVLYQQIQLLDILNPAIYSWFFAMMLYLLSRKTRLAWMVILPLFVGLFDYVENFTLYLMASSFPNVSDQLVTVSSNLSIIKGMAIAGSAAAILIGVFFQIWARSMALRAKSQG